RRGDRPAARSGSAAARTGAWPWAAAAAPAATPSDRHAFDGEFECRAGACRLDLIRPLGKVLAGHRPSVAPEQRSDVEHAPAAAIEIRFVVQGELLHTV